jgi:hypothetical protein
MKTMKEVTISELEGGYVLTKRTRGFDDEENMVSENINQAVAMSASEACSLAESFLKGGKHSKQKAE